MRLSAQEERAAKVKRITLDGKPLALSSVMTLDDEEGWVDVALPRTEALKDAFTQDNKLNEEQAPGAEFDVKRLYGKVEVLWHD